MTLPEPLMPIAKPPAAPKRLSTEARALWRAVTSEYLLEPQHLSILERACEQLDRLGRPRRRLPTMA